MPRRSRSRSSSNSRSSTRQSNVPVQAAPQVPSTQTPQKQPGLIAQTMSTAAGVGMGHVIGSGISNMLFGGRSSEPVQEQPQAPPQQPMSTTMNENPSMCKPYQDQFYKCMNDNGQNFESCKYFYEMLRSCQQ